VKTLLTLFLALSLSAIGLSLTYIAQGQAPAANPSQTTAHLGFDRDIYPGDAAFPVLRKTFAFTSFWLSPPPGEKVTTWLGKRDLLRKEALGFWFYIADATAVNSRMPPTVRARALSMRRLRRRPQKSRVFHPAQ
jgi:hypothetical protein